VQSQFAVPHSRNSSGGRSHLARRRELCFPKFSRNGSDNIPLDSGVQVDSLVICSGICFPGNQTMQKGLASLGRCRERDSGNG
jgi:hypothetical protein